MPLADTGSDRSPAGAHSEEWSRQVLAHTEGPGVDQEDRERKRAAGRIRQLGCKRKLSADPAGNKKGTKTEGRWALTCSKSSEREGGNATTENGN